MKSIVFGLGALIRGVACVILILPLTQLVLQPAEAQPVVRAVLNAASGDSTTIARGSFMSIYGDQLGTQAGPPSSLPLPTTLGGATVTITPDGGTKTYQAYLHFVSPGQINAVMPSAVPAGPASLTVTVNNQTSFKAPVQVSESNFGIFTIASQPAGMAIAQNYESPTSLPLNLYTNPARPGQTLILWGTGLGAYTAGPDNDAPQAGNIVDNAKVLVAGYEITPFYAGRAPGIPAVDQINFTLPADAPIPDGCSLQVQVQIGDSVQYSTATIAKSSYAPVCQHPYGLSTDLLNKLQQGGTVSASIALVERAYGVLGIANGAPFGSIKEEILVQTRKFTANGSPLTNQGFEYAMSQAPGSCTVISADQGKLDLVDYLDVNIDSAPLDAGSTLTLAGPGTTKQFSALGSLETIFEGTSLPGGAGGLQSALVDGDWTITGTGGQDVKAFSAPFTLKNQFNLTNIPASITRGQPLPLTWTGGGTGESDLVRIAIWGSSIGTTTPVIVCTASAKDGAFTVPDSVTSQLATDLGGGVLSAYSTTTAANFTAPLAAGGNLDSGVIKLNILDGFAGITIK
jgi:uncharacterized protein (TIGR03437 family)